jgi:hypothetical protein
MATKRRLQSADLDRLSKLCGLFSSDHAGERANAAGLADRFLRERGWRWPDVLHAPALPSKADPSTDPWQHALADWPENWREVVWMCQRQRDVTLSARNREFLAAILAYDHRPSAAQLKWLANIVDRVRAGRAGRAP